MDVLAKDAFQTVNFLQMENFLIAHGTCNKDHSIYNGKNGIVNVTVGTTAWLIERKKGSHKTLALSNIMANGHSGVYMGCRYVGKEAILNLSFSFQSFQLPLFDNCHVSF